MSGRMNISSDESIGLVGRVARCLMRGRISWIVNLMAEEWATDDEVTHQKVLGEIRRGWRLFV